MARYVIRQPGGELHVREWLNDAGETTRVDLVPKASASSYERLRLAWAAADRAGKILQADEALLVEQR